MAKEQFETLVERLVGEIIKDTDLELVDVEYVKEREWYLRVFLDKSGGIEVEDCQMVSEQLESQLDQLDPIKQKYYLEVSSPGIDRVLKKERDFVRHIGDRVELHTFGSVEGKKTIVGTLQGLFDGQIHVNVDGADLKVPKDKTSQVRLYIDF